MFSKSAAKAEEVKTAPAQAVVAAGTANLPAEYDYGTSDLGFEDHSKDDYKIPFLAVLQSNSPVCSDESTGARPGMIMNTVTADLFKGSEGVGFIAVSTKHQYLEWIPRDSGGGLAGVHELDSPVVKAATATKAIGKIKLANGNELVETFSVFGLVIDADGNASNAVISFSSTKIKKYKAWMTKARTIMIPLPGGQKVKAPLPAHRYRLKSVKEKNNKGEFFNWDISYDGADAASCRLKPTDPLFQEAVALNELVRSGAAQADHASEHKAAGGEAGEGGDIPF